MMNKRPIVIVDGMNCFIRHFMVNQTINNRSEPVGGVVGFLKFLDALLYRWAPAKLIVVWENGGASPRRKKIYPAYKEKSSGLKNVNLNDVRHDLRNKIFQLTTLNGLLKKTPVCQLFLENTECDDIIAYLVKYTFRNEDRNKLVVSSDKDFYQLLEDDSVMIYDPARKIALQQQYVLDTYNISARNFCLARALVGDTSDNIKGVPGIGLKTVSKRFEDFQRDDVDLSIDDIMKASKALLETKKGAKLKAPKCILESEDLIKTNWKLMYLSSKNLSAAQIKKIEGTIEHHNPKMDQLGLLKEISKAGMNISFDYNKFCTALKQNLLHD